MSATNMDGQIGLQDALRDALFAQTELAESRKDLRTARRHIRELEAKLEAHATAPLRATLPSAQAPDWLPTSASTELPPSLTLPTQMPAWLCSEATDQVPGSPAAPRSPPGVPDQRLRFTAEEMPEWLAAASAEAVALADEEESERELQREREKSAAAELSNLEALYSAARADAAAAEAEMARIQNQVKALEEELRAVRRKAEEDAMKLHAVAAGTAGTVAEQAAMPMPLEFPEREIKVLIASFDKIPDGVKLRATILGYAYTNGHIEHEIRVTLDQQSWDVYRRYSEFKKLHADACEVPWSVYRIESLKEWTVPKLLLHTSDALKKRETLLQDLLAEMVDKIRKARRPLPALEQFLGLHFLMHAQVRREGAEGEVVHG